MKDLPITATSLVGPPLVLRAINLAASRGCRSEAIEARRLDIFTCILRSQRRKLDGSGFYIVILNNIVAYAQGDDDLTSGMEDSNSSPPRSRVGSNGASSSIKRLDWIKMMEQRQLKYSGHSAIDAPIDDNIPINIVSTILQQKPFVTIPGVFNARDISAAPSNRMTTGIIFRSGTLENITLDGIERLRTLGIKTVFDLRSSQERTEHPTPELPEIEIVSHTSEMDDPDSMERLRRRVQASERSRDAEPIDTPFKSVFQHIHDHRGEPFLFHGTAGKDRTGVLAALIQSLAGMSAREIIRDYGLTRVGIEPAKNLLKQEAARLLEQSPDHPGVKAAESFDPDAMRKFLNGLEERHYGVQGWLYTSLGFNERDIVAMINNLRRDWSQMAAGSKEVQSIRI